MYNYMHIYEFSIQILALKIKMKLKWGQKGKYDTISSVYTTYIDYLN